MDIMFINLKLTIFIRILTIYQYILFIIIKKNIVNYIYLHKYEFLISYTYLY